MAETSERGTRCIIREKKPVTPIKNVRNAANMKAPMASGMETPANPVANNAAPGVDQPVKIGVLYRSDSPIQVMAMLMPSAKIQELISAEDAPAAVAA